MKPEAPPVKQAAVSCSSVGAAASSVQLVRSRNQPVYLAWIAPSMNDAEGDSLVRSEVLFPASVS